MEVAAGADALDRLLEWYGKQCNGVWEHSFGIEITTLDNPGWSVKISLDGTDLSTAEWPELKRENGPNDWIQCIRRDNEFRGAGDPAKLNTILDYFLASRGHPDRANVIEMDVPESAFLALPLHDVEFVSCTVTASANGQSTVRVSIVLHDDEVEAAKLRGVPGAEITLIFGKCWRLVTNLLGYADRRELVDDWTASSTSELINEFTSRGIAKGIALVHFRLTFSAGSSLEVVGERLSVEGGLNQAEPTPASLPKLA